MKMRKMNRKKFNNFLDNLFIGDYELLMKQVDTKNKVVYGIVGYKGYKIFISRTGQINKIEEIEAEGDL